MIDKSMLKCLRANMWRILNSQSFEGVKDRFEGLNLPDPLGKELLNFEYVRI